MYREPPGIMRSQPALKPFIRSLVAPQSVTTAPSKPQSPRRMSVSSSRLSEQCSPFTAL